MDKELLAKLVVQAILKDLTERNGLSDAWFGCDRGTMAEIRSEWERIVKDKYNHLELMGRVMGE